METFVGQEAFGDEARFCRGRHAGRVEQPAAVQRGEPTERIILRVSATIRRDSAPSAAGRANGGRPRSRSRRPPSPAGRSAPPARGPRGWPPGCSPGCSSVERRLVQTAPTRIRVTVRFLVLPRFARVSSRTGTAQARRGRRRAKPGGGPSRGGSPVAAGRAVGPPPPAAVRRRPVRGETPAGADRGSRPAGELPAASHRGIDGPAGRPPPARRTGNRRAARPRSS